MKKQIIVTDDDSHSIFIPELDETYHSRHGAIQESRHVFIENGINSLGGLKNVKVFEMGFGTGLNAFLTLEWAEQNNCLIEYQALEKFPLEDELLIKLNFDEGDLDNQNFSKIHSTKWNKLEEINPNFKLKKINADLKSYEIANNYFDIIYFDAFGPKTQPELWTQKVMERLYEALKPSGILVTYCAQGQFKRNLKGAGFEIKELPGPPGKRQMTQGLK